MNIHSMNTDTASVLRLFAVRMVMYLYNSTAEDTWIAYCIQGIIILFIFYLEVIRTTNINNISNDKDKRSEQNK